MQPKIIEKKSLYPFHPNIHFTIYHCTLQIFITSLKIKTTKVNGGGGWKRKGVAADSVTSAEAYYADDFISYVPRNCSKKAAEAISFLEKASPGMEVRSLAFQLNQWLLDPVIGFRHSPFVVCLTDVTPF
ncbi:hypothetical protein CEXT_123781 [Caerostris extrusa]|uniref:Uncharacterized protein n=1 Tax=Caerostris extrusa TaxID=172846 RepID=A0AAV4TAY2_CAEEX|nr:hypothetical protein CEXT_123781 [Caerostris extrusa]